MGGDVLVEETERAASLQSADAPVSDGEGDGPGKVEDMERFEHGGDIYGHPGVVDFSANINPLGIPDAVVQAVRDCATQVDAYPDASCRELRAAIAQAEGVDAGSIVCTAGATDLISRVCLALKPAAALVTAPCFSGYEEALEQARARIVRHELREDEGFQLTERFVEDIGDDIDLVFLCSPNNPTGLTIPRDLVIRIAEAAAEAGAVVVLDECFLDFTREPSCVPLLERLPNLIVMRAFTKLYAMAGLRLGYGICADGDLVARIEQAGQTWAVSTPAQRAGVAALGVEGWTERTRAFVDEQRAVLVRELEALGLQVVPGEANYLLFRSGRELYGPLLERGFLIRRCENYVGLGPGWYRIAVRTEAENAALLEALRDVMEHEPMAN